MQHYVLCTVMNDIMVNKQYIALNPKLKRKIKKSILDDDNRGLISQLLHKRNDARNSLGVHPTGDYRQYTDKRKRCSFSVDVSECVPNLF